MANDTGLTKLACKTAEKFLDALALWNAHWAGDYLPEEWLFRGHANAAWDLYPKAFRPRTVLRTPEGWGTLPAGVTNQEQILAEFQTIKLFFKLADGFCVFLFSASLRSRSMVCLNLVISLASSPMRSEASRSFALWSIGSSSSVPKGDVHGSGGRTS